MGIFNHNFALILILAIMEYYLLERNNLRYLFKLINEFFLFLNELSNKHL